jgi:hypothetical protein
MASRTDRGASSNLIFSIFLALSSAVAAIVNRSNPTTAPTLSRQINPRIIFS